MDKSEVDRAVAGNLDVLKWQLGIERWDVRHTVATQPITDGVWLRGECTRLVDYQSAHISLNADAFDFDSDVIRTLRHELLHIVLAPLDVYSGAVDQLSLSDDCKAMLDRIREYALERCIANLELMADRAATPPAVDDGKPLPDHK